jgi:lipopolysaccharide/colanic/teichoic acid biosynthesis glycosyltransferase
LDLIATLIIFIIFSPFFLIIAVCIKVDSKGPVIFRQERVSRDLRLFTLYKFRSMVNKENEMKKIVGRDEGVTRVGY